MRIQILELPRKTADGPIPFTLIFSEIESEERETRIADDWGDEAGLAFGDDCIGAYFTTDEVELGPPEQNLDQPIDFGASKGLITDEAWILAHPNFGSGSYVTGGLIQNPPHDGR